MIRNKFIRSCFAFALALSIILPSFAVHADGEITQLQLKTSYTTRKGTPIFSFESDAALGLITSVEVNDKALTESFESIDESGCISAGLYHKFFYNDIGPKRHLLLTSGLKVNDKIELITAKGKLEFNHKTGL